MVVRFDKSSRWKFKQIIRNVNVYDKLIICALLGGGSRGEGVEKQRLGSLINCRLIKTKSRWELSINHCRAQLGYKIKFDWGRGMGDA